MTNRIQSLRSNVAGARPSGQIPGTIYTNFADRQIGVVSPTNAPLDLVGVRFHSTTASYVAGDYVVNGGQMYRAPAAIPAGAFNASNWVAIGNALFDQSLNTTDAVRFRALDIYTGKNGDVLGAVTNFDVGGSATAQWKVNTTTWNATFGMFGAGYAASGLNVPQTAFLATNADNLTLRTARPTPIILGTDNIERMRIDAAGNVGIGTTPNWSLDIARTQAAPTLVQASNLSSDPAASVRFRVSNGTSVGDLQQFGSGTVPSGIFRPNMTLLDASGAGGLLLNAEIASIYFGTTNTERMRIDAAGNVGIGTAAPACMVDIFNQQDGPTLLQVVNNSGAASAQAILRVSNASYSTSLAHTGTGLGGSGMFQPNTGYIYSNALNGFSIINANDAIRFGTNSIERMQIDAAGNVIAAGPIIVGSAAASGAVNFKRTPDGLTVSSIYELADGAGLAVESGGGGATISFRASGTGALGSNLERMRIDANGTVRVMNLDSSQQAVAVVSSDTANLVSVIGGSGSPGTAYGGLPNARQVVLEAQNASSFYIGTITGAAPIVFAIERAERGRFTTDGYFKASNFGTYLFGPGGTPTSLKHEFVSNKDGEECLSVTNSYGLNPYGLVVNFSGGTPNNATNYFYRAQDTAGSRAFILANGGLSNYSANNSNLSDESVKDYITPYDDRELDGLEQSFTSVIWGKYKYRDQTHDDWNHGPTAQGIERAFKLTAPELIDEAALGPKGGEGGDGKHKVVYETDLAHIGHALLARALTEIKELKAAIALLTGGKPASA